MKDKYRIETQKNGDILLKLVKPEIEIDEHKPSKDNLGFCLSSVGAISSSGILGNALNAYTQGNWFATEEAALRAKQGRKLKQKFLYRVKVLNAGWVPDFDNSEQPKHHIFINEGKLFSEVIFSYQKINLNFYFRNSSIGEQLMKEFTAAAYRTILEA